MPCAARSLRDRGRRGRLPAQRADLAGASARGEHRDAARVDQPLGVVGSDRRAPRRRRGHRYLPGSPRLRCEPTSPRGRSQCYGAAGGPGRGARSFTENGASPHLAGFCWGAAYAIHYLALRGRRGSSLALLAPSIVPAAAVRAQSLVTGSSGDATEDPAIAPDAFTRGPAYEQVTVPDSLRFRKLSPRLNGILAEFAFMIGAKVTRLTVPILIVLAETDRVVDNAATEKLFASMRAS